MKQDSVLLDNLLLEQTIDQENLVINRPDQQKLGSKIGFHIFTLVFWVIWASIWFPIFEILNHLFGIELFYDYFSQVDKKMLFYDLFSLFAITAISIVSVIFLWSIFRLLRFGNTRCRRYSAPLTNPHNLSDFFNLSETDISKIQGNRRMMFNFNGDGTIKSIYGGHVVFFQGS